MANRVWRLVTNHEPKMKESACRKYWNDGFIALGWPSDDLGELNPHSARDIRSAYIGHQEWLPHENPAAAAQCLWALYSDKEMRPGDLVILSLYYNRKYEWVVRVTGDYQFVREYDPDLGNYWHRRPVERTHKFASQLWEESGGYADGWKDIWPLVLCRNQVGTP